MSVKRKKGRELAKPRFGSKATTWKIICSVDGAFYQDGYRWSGIEGKLSHCYMDECEVAQKTEVLGSGERPRTGDDCAMCSGGA